MAAAQVGDACHPISGAGLDQGGVEARKTAVRAARSVASLVERARVDIAGRTITVLEQLVDVKGQLL